MATPLERYLSLYSLMLEATKLNDDALYDAVTSEMDPIWFQLSEEEIEKLKDHF